MNFVTTIFVLYFLPVLCIGWALRHWPLVYRYFITVASIFFYAYAGAEYVLLLLLVAALNWGCVRLREHEEWHELPCPECGKTVKLCIKRGYKRWPLAVCITLHVLLLAFFKYAEPLFLMLNNMLGAESELNAWLMESGMGDIVLPAGLSFYTFMGLSYSIDAYRNPEQKPRSFGEVLSYVSFFPTILAGPIMRSHQFFDQMGVRSAQSSDFSEGMSYILSGMFKKVVLATYLSQQLVDPVFASPEDFSSMALMVAIYAYTAQIYCDFSGYTDLAIGIARLMGFQLPANFASPYRSLNLQEFWRRWHITLSQWLRDYLYIPLGGSRRGNRYVNLTLTMVIGGLWHGSGLNFLIWGFFHGIGLAIVHAWHNIQKRWSHLKLRPWARIAAPIFAWLLTIHSVAILWVFFRAKTFADATAVLGGITEGREGDGFSIQIILIIALVLLLQWVGPTWFRRFADFQARLPWYVQALIVGMLGGTVLSMGPEGVLPFIYFDF